MRLQVRISTWLLLLVLVPTVPLLSFLIYSEINYAHERRAAVEATLVFEAERLASDVRDRIALAAGYVSSLAVSNSAKQDDIPALYEFSRRIQTGDTGIAALTLVDRQERMRFLSLRPLGESYPVSAIDSVRTVFRTQVPDLSGPFMSPIRNRQMVALTVPVEVQGTVKYVLRAIIGADTFSQSLAGSALPAGWVAAVIDAQGAVVARSLSPELFVGKSISAQVLERIARKDMGLFVGRTLEGVVTQSVLRPVGSWGWYIAVGVPMETLTEPLRAELRRTIVLSSVLVLLCIAAAVLLSRKVVRGIHDTVHAVQQIETGGPAPIVETGIVELNQMSASLMNVDYYSKLLEQQVEARTQELVTARHQAATFSRELESSVESERQRISREVHDQIGSVFTGIKLLMSSAPVGGFSAAQSEALHAAIDSGLETARRIASELRPPSLDDLGLTSALRQMLGDRFKGLGIQHAVDLQEEECLSARQTIGCYRIAQEACTNVIRHAGATLFSIRGHRTATMTYELTMADNGVGLPDSALREGALGVVGMTERARLLGGSLRLEASELGGVAVRITLPLEISDESL